VSFSFDATKLISFILVISLSSMVFIPLGNVQAEGTWTIEEVDTSGTAGTFTSLALDSSGTPHICYIDTSSQGVIYATYTGSSWTSSRVADGNGYTVMGLDLSEIQHIAYVNQANQVELATWNPSSKKWRTNPVDSTSNNFAWVSMTFDVTGREHLSYVDMDTGDLRMAYWDGAVFVSSTVESNDFVGEHSSIALASNGTVFISYYDRTNGDLRMAFSQDRVNWTISAIDQDGDVGLYTSIRIGSDGLPRISYYDRTKGDLKLARMVGWNSWSITTVDSAGDVGAWSSLALSAHGRTYIAYLDLTYQQLRFARQSGEGFTTEMVDASPGTGYYSSLALGPLGQPRIAYQDAQMGYVKYASGQIEEVTWAPEFTSAPEDGQETVSYEFMPTFNESAVITAFGTDAPFLTWNGTGYHGVPGAEDAGSYWISITALSVNGGQTAEQNSTFIIGDTWAPSFSNLPDNGQVGVLYEHTPVLNESAVITSHSTNAPFLLWNGEAYAGTPGPGHNGSYWINITARSVPGLLSSYQNATFLIGSGWAPIFTNVPANGQETVHYEYVPTFNETVVLIAHGTNAHFLTWNGTGYVGDPGTNGAGGYWINVTARSANGGLSAIQNSTFIITDSWAPSITTDPVTSGRELSPYAYAPLSNESVSWTVVENAPFLGWDGTKLSGTPGLDDAGSYVISISAQSPLGKGTAWQNFTLVIADTWSPTFTNVPAGGRPGMAYSYVPTFNESVTITSHSTNAPFLTWTGSGYQGTPYVENAGGYWINITATSEAGLLSTYQNRTFAIGEGWPPSFTSSPQDGRETFPYGYFPTFNESAVITAFGTDAQFLTWTDAGYQGTPGLGTAGDYWINITATSVAGAGTAYQNITFTVAASWAPAFTNSPGNGREAVSYGFVPTFNESVTITAHGTNAPFLAWNGSGYQGTPGLAQSGNYWIRVAALSVGGGLSVDRNSTFIIYDSWAPTFTSLPATEGRELSPYLYLPSCNETVIWTVSYDAPFLVWNGSALSGIPGASGSGTYSVHLGAISVSGALTTWQNFTLMIGDSWAPTFLSVPQDGCIAFPYEYVPQFNESADITAHGTDAPFLRWMGDHYQGTPDVEDAGSYWINITARSLNGTLSSHQNRTFQVVQGWAPSFTNAPPDGMELYLYEHTPALNESAVITSHSTNAPFLLWNGHGYAGTPQMGQAGTYWINTTALSSSGRAPAWQNGTFAIVPIGPPTFTSDAPSGPFFAPLELVYAIETSEPCDLVMDTDAGFLGLQGDQVRGEMVPGTYHVHLLAISERSGLTCWQNFTLQVGTDDEPPELIIEGLTDDAYTNRTSLELDLSSMDGDGSGGVSFWSRINQDPWRSHGQVSRITLELPQGTSIIQIKGVDRVGNEAMANLTVHIDTVAPVVVHHSHTGTAVSPEGALSVAFSKAMERSSVMVRVNGAPADLTWQNDTALLSPSEGWAEDTEYNVSVSGRDLYGNQLPEVSWTFRTGFVMVLASGTVLDPFGNPVANATLSINGTVVAITDQDGHFSFELRPGSYLIIVSGRGFEDLIFEVTAAPTVPVQVSTMLEWHHEIPWTVWLPLPFFILQAALMFAYRRRHP